jgi:hypothetical protein
MTVTTTMVVQLVGLYSGRPTPLDGQWLVDYDPTQPGVGPGGEPMTARLRCTPNRDEARRFATGADALRYVGATSGLTRPDGKPDRPITAYHLLIESADVKENTPDDRQY